jgi:hypothetical protein
VTSDSGGCHENRTIHLVMLIALVLVSRLDALQDGRYGDLASGAMSYSEVSGVHGEICLDYLFNGTALKLRLPVGYRLTPAADLAKEDSRISPLLQRDKRYASYSVGTLCFMAVDAFLVDGVSAHPNGPTAAAFWWVRAQAPPIEQRDSRMRGDTDYVQLAIWFAREGTDQARIIKSDPMAQFVDLSVTQVRPTRWQLRLALPTETVEGEVRLDGKRTDMNRPTPGYVTVPESGDHTDYFTVFTFFGHHQQPATGQWRAQGSGVFSEALATSGENLTLGTDFEDGWQARSGLYKR